VDPLGGADLHFCSLQSDTGAALTYSAMYEQEGTIQLFAAAKCLSESCNLLLAARCRTSLPCHCSWQASQYSPAYFSMTHSELTRFVQGRFSVAKTMNNWWGGALSPRPVSDSA